MVTFVLIGQGQRRVKIAVVGSGRSVHVLVRSTAVAARGHQVRLVTLGEVLPAQGIEVRTQPIPRNLPQAALAARRFLQDVRSFQPDLLHLHYAGSKLGTMALLTGVRPFVVTVMGGEVQPGMHPRGLPGIEAWATRRILKAADLILAKSEALRRTLAALGTFPGQIETVRWGIDPLRYHRVPEAARALRQRLGLTRGQRVILSPRIVNPVYNQRLIVEAMPGVRERVPEAVLLMPLYNADPEYQEAVAARARELGVTSSVRFVERFEQADMPALHSLAEVVVSMATADGLPQSVLEAMACETPVVLNPLPAYEELVIDGQNAIYAERRADRIAAALVEVLGDEALRIRLAAAALERVSALAFLPREVERVDGFYRRLLASPVGRRRASRLPDALSLLLR